MNRNALRVAVLSLALIGAGFALLNRLRSHQALGRPAVVVVPGVLAPTTNNAVRTNAVVMPERLAGFDSVPGEITAMELDFLPPDTSFGRRIYQAAEGNLYVQANVVLMGSDRTSIHQPDFCLTGVGWNIQRKRAAEITLETTLRRNLTVSRYDASKLVRLPDGRVVQAAGIYVFWFVADGVETANVWHRTLATMQSVLLKNTLPRWGYLSFFAQCPPGQEDVTFDRMARLIAAYAPQVMRQPDPASTAAVQTR